MPTKDEWKNALKIEIDSLKERGTEAGQAVADGGRDAGKAVEESAAFLKVAGVDVGAQIMAAAQKLADAASRFNTANAALGAASQGRPVNADRGRSMPPSANTPGGSF